MTGFFQFIGEVLKEHGSVAVALVTVTVLFYKMTWSVWRDAMKAKNEEIERLVAERNKYQQIVFERLLSSKETPVKEAANGSKPASEGTPAGKPTTDGGSPGVTKPAGASS